MKRREFLQTATGIAAAAALSGTVAPALSGTVSAAVSGNAAAADTEKKGPKRGVSVYSYAIDFDVSANLEDCMIEISQLRTPGQKIGIEILANGHIEGYPNPSDAWVKKWYDMCEKYQIQPVELGHWVDSKLYHEGPEGLLSTKESVAQLIQDIKLGNKLGFTRGRTKLGVIDEELMPVPNWREIIKAALPYAEKYNFRMLTEFHSPTPLKGRVMDQFMDFITKEKCNPWFAINVDFSVFQTKPGNAIGPSLGANPSAASPSQGGVSADRMPLAKPEDIIPLLSYVHCCHAKFNDINNDCVDQTIPYPEIVKIMVDHQWDGYLISEYEGVDKPTGGAWSAVRRQHVLLKRLLREA